MSRMGHDSPPSRVHVHELISENASLKARLNSTLQELKTTKDICLRNMKPKQGKKDGNTQWVFALHSDAGCQTKTPPPTFEAEAQTVLIEGSDTSGEIRRLKAEVLRSHAESASLQQAVNVLRRSITSSPDRYPPMSEVDSPETVAMSPTRDVVGEADIALEETQNRINILSEALRSADLQLSDKDREIGELKVMLGSVEIASASIKARGGADPTELTGQMLHKSVGTDDPLIDTTLPVTTQDRSNLRGSSEHAAALQSALDITRQQLNEALEELASQRAENIFDSPQRSLRVKTDNASVMVDTLYPFERLFRLHKREFTPEAVEAMLMELDHTTQQRVLALENKPQMELIVADTSEANSLREQLDVARRDVMDAHSKIDELEYAMELEKRDRSRQVALFGGEESNKQAAAEIAFLCDTLSATRSELERVTTKLDQVQVERDAAVESFRDLRIRSEEMLVGCREIAESTRNESDVSIQQLTAALRNKDHDLNLVRGQMAALSRTLEETKKKKDETEKECTATKAKLMQLRDSVARLREDYNIQSMALREARASANNFAVAISTPRVEAAAAAQSASPQRDQTTSLQALEASLQRESPTPRESPTTLRSPVVSSRKPATARSSSVRSEVVNLDYKEEYDELKSCFLKLAPMVPGATTAREVTQGITAGLQKLNERIKGLEADVKKRMTQTQSMKKDLVAANEQVQTLERKVQHLDSVEQRATSREKLAEKAKRAMNSTKAEAERDRAHFQFEKESLSVELDRTKEALALARKELAEGRELMMGLIQDT